MNEGWSMHNQRIAWSLARWWGSMWCHHSRLTRSNCAIDRCCIWADSCGKLPHSSHPHDIYICRWDEKSSPHQWHQGTFTALYVYCKHYIFSPTPRIQVDRGNRFRLDTAPWSLGPYAREHERKISGFIPKWTNSRNFHFLRVYKLVWKNLKKFVQECRYFSRVLLPETRMGTTFDIG